MWRCEQFNWLARSATTVESDMACVERIVHYANLPDESATPAAAAEVAVPLKAGRGVTAFTSESTAAVKISHVPVVVEPPEEWPTRGDVSFEGVCMRYKANLEPVLRGVTFRLSAGEKCGVVGRYAAMFACALCRPPTCGCGGAASCPVQHRCRQVVARVGAVPHRVSVRWNGDAERRRLQHRAASAAAGVALHHSADTRAV
jgi:hypothetical protein